MQSAYKLCTVSTDYTQANVYVHSLNRLCVFLIRVDVYMSTRICVYTYMSGGTAALLGEGEGGQGLKPFTKCYLVRY